MDLRRLLLATTVATTLTALLGVFTATVGAGLTCEAQWPLCDGPFGGLLPANPMSAVEWTHRVVAGVTGVLIVASTAAAWRGGHDRRVRYATLGALALTPVQVVFGAFTVLVRQFVFGYSILVLTLHFALAAAILALLVAATLWASAAADAVSTPSIQRAGAAALLAFPVLLVLTPRLFVTFGALAQFVYYGAGFGAVAALTAVALWAREVAQPAVAAAAGAAVVLLVGQLVLARRALDGSGQLAVLGLSVAAFALAALAVWRLREPAPAAGTATSTGD